MSLLIDTNVISEVRKGSRCHPRVAAWFGSVDQADIYLSTLVLGEIRKGVEKARTSDSTKAAILEAWLLQVAAAFKDRIVPIDHAVSDEWGRMSAIRSISVVDGLLAASAKVRGMTLVTRNATDVAGLGATVLDPFSA